MRRVSRPVLHPFFVCRKPKPCERLRLHEHHPLVPSAFTGLQNTPRASVCCLRAAADGPSTRGPAGFPTAAVVILHAPPLNGRKVKFVQR